MKIKNLIVAAAIVGLVACLSVPKAEAQLSIGSGSTTARYGYQSVSMTNILPLAASSASNTVNVLDLRFQKDTALQITMANKGAGTTGVTLYFVPSDDNITFASSGIGINLPTPNASTNTIVTNLVSWGAGYWKLAYVTNACAAGSDITNLFLTYAVKVSAP